MLAAPPVLTPLESGGYNTDTEPSWSTNGTRFTWVTNRDATDPLRIATDIYVAQLDGTGLVRATTDAEVEYAPEFSPDDTEILCQRNFYDPEIWVVPAPPPPGEAAGAGIAATTSWSGSAAHPAGSR